MAFGKPKTLMLAFPDGRLVESAEDLAEVREKFTLTPKTITSWTLAKPDIEAWAEASSVLFSLGMSSYETIIATGPIIINSFPKENNSYSGKGILTTERVVLYWQKGKLDKELVIVDLNNLKGVTPHGPWSAAFSFSNGIHLEKGKAWEMELTYFELAEKFGKDLQANRRCINLMDSLSRTLIEMA